jgi:SAM-dependent methyltransferase
MADAQVYDRIGHGYVASRRPDARIARAIDAALGDAASVVNVGAGAGSYEPSDRGVVAVEPSAEMIRQRPRDAAPAIQSVAEHLPFGDAAFDAALAVLTVHHWTDVAAGLRELRRVSRRRIVILTWDPEPASRPAFWLIDEYLPALIDFDVQRFPALTDMARMAPGMRAIPVPIPHDCIDGFLGAFWRRPEAYLDPNVRRAISGFAQLPRAHVDDCVARLDADLRSGRWDRRFGHLRSQDELDLGYRLIVAEIAR